MLARRPIRYLFFILLFALLLGFFIALSAPPRADRQWDNGFSRTPQFTEIDGSQWRLTDLRAFAFDDASAANQAWRTVEFNPTELTEVWFFVEPFEAWGGVAHTLLSFVFDGDDPQTLSISVEARREEGETYSGFRGLFNAYELINVWSTEKDILTRIAVSLDHDIYAYRLNVTPEQAQVILQHFIRRTNELHERPRYYNTLTSNCTNELAKAVNDAFPGALPPHYSHWLTGYSGQRLHELGFLGAPHETFADLKRKANMRDSIQAMQGISVDTFPMAWRAHFVEQRQNVNKTQHDE
ncbi:MAG: DUF4105 domain-containing protein [Pseudomonadota bacterium]